MLGTPSWLLLPNVSRFFGMPCTIARPLVYQSTAPRMTEAVPRVTMNGSMLKTVTIRPLSSPTKAPTAIPKSTPISSGTC